MTIPTKFRPLGILLLLLVMPHVPFRHTSSLHAQVVLLPHDEPLLEQKSITRQDLATILISYFPARLLVLLSGSRSIPDQESDPEEIRDFLDRTDILPRFSDGSFHPGDTVHRNQLAIVLERIARKLDSMPLPEGLAASPVDVLPDRYDRLPIREVLTLGLMHTDANGRFRPDAPLSGRDAVEAVVSLSRLSSAPGDGARKNP